MKYKKTFFVILFTSCFLVSLIFVNKALAGTATLSWNANTEPDLAGYKIYYGTSPRTGTCPPGGYTNNVNVGNVTSYTFNNLTNGQTYYFSVTAYDTSNNESGCSSEVSKVISATDTTPPIISSISASSITSSGTTIAWTTNEAADSQVEYGLTTSYGNSTSLNTSMVTAHSVSLSGLSASTLYHYRVKSRDAAGNLATSNNFTFTTIAGPGSTIPAPTNLTATAISSTQINLTWTAVYLDSGVVAGYIIFRGGVQIGTSVTNSYSNTGLSPSTTYTYTVAAYNNAGNTSGQSNQASATTFAQSDTAPPSTPANLLATAISSTQINLTWTASTDNVGVTGYRIYRWQGPGSTPTQIGTTATISYSDTGLTANTTYSYTVSAYDAAGNVSGQSSSASATTWPTTSTKFSINDRVRTIAALNIRTCAGISCTLLGTQPSGALGTVIGGPTYTDAYWWWNINFDNAPDGWSVEDYLVKVDITPPTVSITSPATGSTVSNTVTVSANASDNVGVAGVQFKLDGVNLGAEDTISPYSISWNTTTATNGSHTLTALARDAEGNQTTSSGVAVTVSNILPDTTPPSVPAGLTATAISTSQINLSWVASTDPTVSGQVTSGLAGYRVYRGGTQIATVTTTSYSDTGLSPSTTYTYTIAAYDVAGNVSAQSSSASATTQAPADTTPPSRFNKIPSANLNYKTTEALMGLNTDESATCRYSATANTAYSSMTNTLSNIGGLTHYAIITGLTSNSSSNYYVKCQDTKGNANLDDFTITVTVSNDTTVPTRTNNFPRGNLSKRTTAVILSLNTDENATCRYSTAASTVYSSMTNTFTNTGGLTHSTPITGLTVGTTYKYYVRCQDVRGNANTNDFTISFTVSSSVASSETPDQTLAMAEEPPLQLTSPLSYGSQSEEVTFLQQILSKINEIYPERLITGFFGNLTQKAVQKFQCEYGIVCEGDPETTGHGMVGPKTREVINEMLTASVADGF